MFLKNFYDALFVQTSGVNKTMTDISGSSKTITTSEASWILNLGSTYMTGLASNRTSYGFQFGTGDTPVAFTDQRLSGDFISGLTATIAKSTDDTDTGRTMTIIATITNNNSDEVTIKEVCIVTYSNGKGSYAVERTILDSPVPIPAGGIGQVTYTIKFNYPT